MRLDLRHARLFTAVAAIILLPFAALAQSDNNDEVIEEIFVTGSYIKGSDTAGALPIESLGRNDLEALGAPTTADIVNNLTINSGSENRSNALGGQNRNTGTANMNLRGLGLDKTLVLFNGKRNTIHATSAGSGASFVDINLVPGIAVERIEVLKDGAAATYGSDAVAGVVNFLTRNDFEGLEIQATYRDRTDGGAGNYDISGIWGWSGDNSNLVIAAAYGGVEQMVADEVDWTVGQLDANRGVSTLAAPGAFIPLANPTTGFFAGAPVAGLPIIANDPASPAPDCGPEGIVFNALGGTADIGTPAFVGRCGYSFVEHYHLQDEQDKINLWATYEAAIGADHEFYGEAAYYRVDVSGIGNSPSFPVLRFEAIPATHPANPHGVPGIYLGRPFGQTYPTEPSFRDYETYRFVGGFRGLIGENWTYDTSLSYSSNNVEESSPTVLQQRFSDGLDGLGGPNCDTVNGTPGVGDCMWFNPFSTRFGSDPAFINNPAVENFMRSSNDLDQTAELLVLDAVFTRDLWDMSAGTVQGAFGVQYRDESLEVKRNPEALIPNNFIFVGGGIETDDSQDVYAVFGELAIPLSDSWEAQVALRYEDYGDQIGDTWDPKLALLWQVNDSVGLRASASTTFRAPTLHQRFNQETNLIALVDQGTTGFKGVDQTGNPDLKPETATTFNIGLVLSDLGPFNMTLDYWNIDFEDVIAIENAQTKVSIENVLCPTLDPGCRDADILRNRLPGDPLPADNPVNASGEISKVISRYINAPTVETSGVDLRASLGFDVGATGSLLFGLDYSYMLDYDISGILGVVGGQVVPITIDAVGNRNEQNIAVPLPQWKSNLYMDWIVNENHSGKVVVRHIDEYNDDKTLTQQFNDKIDSWTTVDVYYTFLFNQGLTSIHGNIINATDEEPPFADQDLNFDARTHSPFGRQYQLVLRHNFDF
ncbi:MAG: TonB-dependent receptor [Gammaproteobacteria bacterium]|nr:TonB-dependent receptor [Gammaproteobacteria bacterium]